MLMIEYVNISNKMLQTHHINENDISLDKNKFLIKF